MGKGSHGPIALVALALLALAAWAPATPAKAGSGPQNGTTSDPLPLSPQLYQTPTPTATPLPDAPDCRASQLAAQFGMGGVGTGNMFGTILLRNVSATACSMEGAQRFYGVDAQGRRVTVNHFNQLQSLARVVLPPPTPVSLPGVSPTPGAYLEILIMGAYRDDWTTAGENGLCTAASEVMPARFVVTIGAVTLRLPNYSPVAGWAGFHGVEGCHGAIGAGGALLTPQ
jgi:hypothetical protein